MDNISTRSSPVPSRANSRRAASSCTPSITGGSRRSSATLPTSNTRSGCATPSTGVRRRKRTMSASALARRLSTPWRRSDEETILARIRPLVHKTRTNKIVSDRMVVNAAFLVDRQNGLQFDDAVRRLSDDFNDRLMFKYFGPVPPYNFVNITVNWEG